jgi:ABC-type transport system involved in multi-copper enzyme maturation permease subunit
MKAIFIIGVNFVRQQRIVTYIFLAWIVIFGVLFGWGTNRDASDVLALFHQQAAYGVLYTLFIAAASVHGERKSRRIIAVLSKGITRREYLAGLMLGSVMMTGIYMVSLGVVNQLVGAGHRSFELWSIILAASIAAILVSAIGVAFSTFAHPLIATAATVMVAGLPVAFRFVVGEHWGILAPVPYVIEKIFESSFHSGWTAGWAFVPVALLETVLFWVFAGIIFQSRDVTLAIE